MLLLATTVDPDPVQSTREVEKIRDDCSNYPDLVCGKAHPVEKNGTGWDVCVQKSQTSGFDLLTLFCMEQIMDSLKYRRHSETKLNIFFNIFF